MKDFHHLVEETLYLIGTNTGNISLSVISVILWSTGVTGASLVSASGGGGGGAATVKTI